MFLLVNVLNHVIHRSCKISVFRQALNLSPIHPVRLEEARSLGKMLPQPLLR